MYCTFILLGLYCLENKTTQNPRKTMTLITTESIKGDETKQRTKKKDFTQSKVLYVPPILGQLLDLISSPKIDLFEPRFKS